MRRALFRPITLLMIAFWLSSPIWAQQGDSVETPMTEQEARELLPLAEPVVVHAARLILSAAFSDPQLTIQELDSLTAALAKFEKAVVKWPSMSEQFASIYNVLELTRLATMAEFGLTDEFEEQILPTVAESKFADHKASSLITGFRSALEHGHQDQARRFLNLALKLKSEDTAGDLDPVFRYAIGSLSTMLRVAGEETISKVELDRLFTQAWEPMKSYDPHEDLASDVSWYHGRYVTKFWMSQFLRAGDLDSSAFAPANEQLRYWITNFKPVISAPESEPLSQADQAQGVITYFTSTIDIALYPYEENPELLLRPSVADFHERMVQAFAFVDQVADSLSSVLNVEGYAPIDLKSTVYLESLKIRSQVIFGLDTRLPVEKRREALALLPARIEKLVTPASYISTNLRLGQAFLSVGQADDAVSAWKRALKRAQETGFDYWSAKAARLLAEEYARQGDWLQSGNYSAIASNDLYDRLGTLDSNQLSTQTAELSTEQATALIHSDQPEKALEVLNHGRQLSLAAVQVEGDPQTKDALRELARKKSALQNLKEKVVRLESMPASETRDSLLEKAQVSLAGSRSEFLTESRRIRAKFPKLYSSSLKFDPLDMAEIQGTLAPDTAVVQYFPTEHELYFFVVTRDKFRIRSLKVEKSNIDELVLKFLSQVRNISPQERESARKLYDILIRPVADDIAASEQLVLIPSGRLNILPFGALLGERRLIEEKTLVELAKTTDFLKISSDQPKPFERAVTFANATLDLPGTVEEGKVVRSLFPDSHLFQGAEANKENLAKFGSQADILHLATHGVWDATDSLQNYLSLSNGERLGQDDIFSLDLSRTSMVTLSACNTALGDTQDLGYVSSLAEAFWIAGSRSVVATLWSVEDGSTSDLMSRFYTELKQGRSRSLALRDAQRAVMSNPTYAHPYYWSGFILFGDYR